MPVLTEPCPLTPPAPDILPLTAYRLLPTFYSLKRGKEVLLAVRGDLGQNGNRRLEIRRSIEP